MYDGFVQADIKDKVSNLIDLVFTYQSEKAVSPEIGRHNATAYTLILTKTERVLVRVRQCIIEY